MVGALSPVNHEFLVSFNKYVQSTIQSFTNRNTNIGVVYSENNDSYVSRTRTHDNIDEMNEENGGGEVLDLNILSAAQGHLRTNPTFKMSLTLVHLSGTHCHCTFEMPQPSTLFSSMNQPQTMKTRRWTSSTSSMIAHRPLSHRWLVHGIVGCV